MPASNVRFAPPLVREKPFYPGQFGVAGSDVPLGERLSTTGKIIYVDPNYIGVTNDPDGTDPECPIQTIAAALSRCSNFAGDVIVVAPNDDWQYGPRTTDRNTAIAEDVVVTVHGVSIVGLAPSSPIGVIWKPATAGGVACTIAALDVLVEGFAFCESDAGAGGGTGIYCAWDGVATYGDSAVVRNCYFGDGIDIGVQLDYAWNCYIEDCEFQDVVEGAIWCDPADSAAAYCVIRRNWFYDCGLGQNGAISMNECDDNLIADNWIYNHVAIGAGVATDEGIDLGAGSNNLVANNWLSCILPVGANGDYADLNSGTATDAWINNHCTNGDATTVP